MSTLFLNETELAELTGRKYKSRQIEWLRSSGIPFRVNARGHAVVTRGAIEGRKPEPEPVAQKSWKPRVVGVQ
ncbi:DUF4224 domain-containing protein [Comamonas odontotermitis]|uniref:DUF4224 domain-containing protein n=1 Tax=Comamonas odontotermitis TaxID=379895 RepID=UPI001CC39754|nr:DUF4224 domain-containing protein [Comamonas odontotermitis]UBB15485.1 DUF4224 domain-containing protein [Comamonas odontotermitis]